jgi:hypothetical protein
MSTPLNTFGKGESSKSNTDHHDDTGAFANRTYAKLDQFLEEHPELNIQRNRGTRDVDDE